MGLYGVLAANLLGLTLGAVYIQRTFVVLGLVSRVPKASRSLLAKSVGIAVIPIITNGFVDVDFEDKFLISIVAFAALTFVHRKKGVSALTRFSKDAASLRLNSHPKKSR
jgi:uncharacterized membrane protein